MERKKTRNPSTEQCWSKFALTESNVEEGTFVGLASVFGSKVDAWTPTVIEPGAFRKTLLENSSRVKLLWQHNPDEPIGIPTQLYETDAGLVVHGKISNTQRGREAIMLMKDGVIDELSIGFDPIKWEIEDIGDGKTMRHLKEVRLWEISPVTFAADPMAKIEAVHNQAVEEKPQTVEEIMEMLQVLVPLEAHEGKTFSKKTKQALTEMITALMDKASALQALIAAAEPPEPVIEPEPQALTLTAEHLAQLQLARLRVARLKHC